MACFPDKDVAWEHPEGVGALPRHAGRRPLVSDVPGLVPTAAVLSVSDHVAIIVTGILVRREGVEFRITRRLRRKDLPDAQWQPMVAAFVEHGSSHAGAASTGRLHYGH